MPLKQVLRSSAGLSLYLTGRTLPLVITNLSDRDRVEGVLTGLVRAGDLSPDDKARVLQQAYPAEAVSHG